MLNQRFEPLEPVLSDTYRHWSPWSEKYTGGDALLTAIENGWQPFGIVFREEFWLAGIRRVYVYHVRLCNRTSTVTMAVVDNPVVTALIQSFKLQIVQQNERKTSRTFIPIGAHVGHR
jgi:hypothetical protein